MKRLSACRLCGGGLDLALELAPMPLVDDYDSGPDAVLYPTELMRCADCGLVQLGVVVPPAVLFSGYSYRTGHSPGLVAHFRDYAAEIGQRAELTPKSLAIDIGANDGTLLRLLCERTGCGVLGIDPCPADMLVRKGEMTPDLAGEIVATHGPADLVTANNVLAHVDDLAGTLRATRMLLRPGGWFVCEVGSLEAMCEAGIWETVYHEHLSYFDAGTLAAALRGAGLWPVEIRRIATHGGSLRVICQRSIEAAPGCAPTLTRTSLSGPSGKIAYRGARLRELGADGAVAFGASAKASVILWQTGLRPRAVIDDNPLKQGKRMPGTDIPIVDRKALADAEKVVVLAWNELPAIAGALPEFKGRLIVAAPEPYLA
jgi:SAM-dependent methyltransferase